MRRVIIWTDGETGFWMRWHPQCPPLWCDSREAVCAIASRLADEAPQY